VSYDGVEDVISWGDRVNGRSADL